ncbi:Cadherin domain protein [Rhodopirellula maiorica SM1]|uniref:Cadherin domain protein n=1 Tax=Rhodopirellula maiorica SM1 TaxID=1265738 RepID=M5RIU2_9BACT|nr:Ig-like domain-containing protein [Rhodopirellula maiorica]EMI15277.1 Cadherin domain protein [Rhodopirellula maiorica SM1]
MDSPAGQVDNVSDADSGAALGIAVTAANTTNGTWYYSIDNGSTWNALGAVSDSNARLLAADANTRLYFQPNADYFGTLADAITFRAWDQTSGSNGGVADTSSTSETFLDTFSSVSYSNNDGSLSWSTDWIENDAGGGGASGGKYFVSGGLLNVGESNSDKYIYREANLSSANTATFSFDLVTNNLGGGGAILAQISSNGGSTWTTLLAVNSGTATGTKSFDISAYIASNTQIRFYDSNGGGKEILVDNVQITDTRALSGGTTAFSSETDTASIVVNPVADTPSITGATTDEDTQSTSGLVITRNAADGAEVTHYKITGITDGTLYKNDGVTEISNGSFITVAEGTAGLKFTPNADFNGTGNFTVQASTSNDDSGLGGGTTVANVTVDAVNDTPVVNGPGSALSATEQVGLAIEGSGFTVNDIDAGSGTMTATINVGEGTITTTAGDSGVTIGSGNGTGTVTITGTLSQIDNLLTGVSSGTITYLNSSDTPSASTTITVTVNDGGNTGSDPGLTGDGSSEEDSASQTINITATNDDPTNPGGLPSDIAVTEDVSSNVDLSQINLSDVDHGGGNLTVTLTTSTGGNLTASSGGGVTIGGSGTGTLTLTGTLANLNAYIDTASNIQYLHSTANLNGGNVDTINVKVNDNGNSGSGGGGDVDLGTVNVDITAVNDAPINTVPGTQTVAEETATTISGISISDIDAASGNVTTRLQVTAGVVNVTLAGSASISAGTNGTGDLTIQGSVADINATLASLSYTGNADVIGTAADTLTVTTNDGGNTGSGGALQDTDTVQINITAVNDTPAVNGPGTTLSATEQVGLAIEGTGFTVTDVDAASGTMTATIAVGEGTISVAGGDSGITISSGNGTGIVTITGTLSQIDNLLIGAGTGTITYLNSSDTPSSSTTITVTVNDGGNTGADPGLTADGTSEEDSASQTINITATNDDPTNPGGLPSDITVTEDVSSDVDLSQMNLSDVDHGGGSLTVTLTTSTGGNLTASSGGGVTIGGSGTGILTLTGTLADLNTYLDTASNIQYLHSAANTNGDNADSVAVKVNDNGNTGSGGGGDVALGSVNVDVTAVNDAPVLDNSETFSMSDITEDQTNNSGDTVASIIASLSGDRITDVDNAASEGIAIRGISGGNGTWQYSLDGSTWTNVGSVGTSTSLLLRSTDYLRYVPDAMNSDVSSVTFVAWDQTIGTEGTKVSTAATGGTTAFSDNVGTAQVTVTAVNDAPTITDSATVNLSTTSEDSPSTATSVDSIISSAGWADVDTAAVNGIAVTAVNGNGSWEYSTDGTNWTSFSGITASNALLLSASTQIRYQPDTHNGETATFEFVAWDTTTGSPSAFGSPAYANPASGGGTSAFSSESATASIVVTDVNDAVVTVGDTATATEASGVANTTAGTNPTGNVLDNDSDVDNGDTKNISGVSAGVAASATGNVAANVAGLYGSIHIAANGSYSYTVDNNNADVQDLLSASDTLTDVFTYTVQDASGAESTTQITITIQGGDDAPVAFSDNGDAYEASGIANATAGSDATGNVLGNDDPIDAGDTWSVTGIAQGVAGSTSGSVNAMVSGNFGSITLDANGNYTYTIDETNTTVQALRTSSNTLSDVFSYTIADGSGQQSTSQITITLHGNNDNPVATADNAIAVEASGYANGTSGTDPTGNVLSNDTDVDSGDTKSVSGVVAGLAGSASGNVGSSVTGSYGQIMIASDGSYTYVVDNDNVAVQALRTSTDTLQDVFTYTMVDTAGAPSTTQITITIEGSNDAPVAVPDAATAVEAGGVSNATSGTNPSGNVLSNDTDVDSGDSKSIDGVASGVQGSTSGNVGANVAGNYGSIAIQSDGSYTYTVDNDNASVEALRSSAETLSDVFTYTMVDASGLKSTEQITITIQGSNDSPYDITTTSLTIAENLADDQIVGSATPYDIDTGDSFTYALSDDAGGRFRIDASGNIRVLDSSRLDYETATQHDITIRVTDQAGGQYDETVTIHLTDVNEFDVTPANDIDASANEVSENASTLSLVGLTANATDADGTNNAVTYSLSDDAGGRFAIDTNTGVVTVAGSFDYETQTSHTITVASQSSDGSTRFSSFTINVLDENEAPTAQNDNYSVHSSQTLSIAAPGVLANDADIEGDVLQLHLISGPNHGVLTERLDGSFVYIPANGFFGTDTFTYVANDGHFDSNVVTVTITVNAVGGGGTSGNDSNAGGGSGDNESNESGDQHENSDSSEADSNENDAEAENGPTAPHGGLGALPLGGTETPSNENVDASSDTRSPRSQPASDIADSLGMQTLAADQQQDLRGREFTFGGSSEMQVRHRLSNETHMLERLLVMDLTHAISWEQWNEEQRANNESTFFGIEQVGAIGAGTGLATVGYVLWALRGGVLLTTIFGSMPAWRMIDPTELLTAYRTTDPKKQSGIESFLD